MRGARPRADFAQRLADVAVQIVQYPHPTLRHVSKPLKRVDAELRAMVGQMFELMYAASGIGLAANQVDLPYRLFVLNTSGDRQQKELEQVFINPVITRRQGSAEGEEGCLSLPGLYAEVKRPEKISVQAYNLQGEEISADLDDLPARAVQHELDHLNGKLFIDHLPPTKLMELRDAIREFELEFDSRRQRGEIGDDQSLRARLLDLEQLRT
ncbi:MAG: peptide deformylase [Planctomycetaceae bacterium]|nr:peptide deformylase [Planctomycetaceae bacterium]